MVFFGWPGTGYGFNTVVKSCVFLCVCVCVCVCLCVFSVCVFCLCVFCGFLSVFSVCFLSVFSLCVFCLRFLSVCFLSVFLIRLRLLPRYQKRYISKYKL